MIEELPARAERQSRGTTIFMNERVVAQGWYVAARSAALKAGQARSLDLLGRRIALYRDERGVARALDARCPHLGADLGLGKVRGEQLACAFHGWRIGPDGRCALAPGLDVPPERRARAYPTAERWGLIWIFNGPVPLYDLPAVGQEAMRVLLTPRQRIKTHPHLVIANGLDQRHFEVLHEMRYDRPPELTVEPPYRISLTLYGRPASPSLRRLTGTEHTPIDITFTTIGASIAAVTIRAPVPGVVLFTGRPVGGECDTQTALMLPRGMWRRLPQALALLALLLRDDRRVLDTINFFPGFTADDAGLRAFSELVNGLPVW